MRFKGKKEKKQKIDTQKLESNPDQQSSKSNFPTIETMNEINEIRCQGNW